MGLLKTLFSRPSANASDQLSSFDRPSAWFRNLFGSSSTAGEMVNSVTAKTLAPYLDAIRIISEDVGVLPFVTYERVEGGRREAIDHHAYDMLRYEPNPDMDAMSFWSAIMANALQFGNGYAEIVRNGKGEAVRMFPIHTSNVTPRRDEDGKLVYDVRIPTLLHGSGVLGNSNRNVRIVRFQQKDIFNLTGIGENGIVGYPIISLASESLGAALAQQRFGGAFYGNGTHMSGVLTHPESLSKEAMTRIREAWSEIYQGAANSNKTAILEEGMSWKSIAVSPKDAQFIQGRQFTVTEIAQWFRIPPHMLGDLSRATFSNIQDQARAYIMQTLISWLTRINMETRRKIFAPFERRRFFAEHDMKVMLLGDMAARSAYFKDLNGMGVMSINDIRDAENMNRVDGGDRRFVQLNTTELLPEGETMMLKPPANTANQMIGFAPVIKQAADRVVKREIKALKQAVKASEDQDAFSEWSVKFYPSIERNVMDAFTPVLASIESLLDVKDFDLSKFAKQFSERSASDAVLAYANESIDYYISLVEADKIEQLEGEFVEAITIGEDDD